MLMSCHEIKSMSHLQPGNLRVAEGVILHQLYHVVIQQAGNKQILMSWTNPKLLSLYIKQLLIQIFYVRLTAHLELYE
jgi:hypothetical protein